MAADELRRQADDFLELEKLIPAIGRSQNRRSPANTAVNPEFSSPLINSDDNEIYNDDAFDEYDTKNKYIVGDTDKSRRT